MKHQTTPRSFGSGTKDKKKKEFLYAWSFLTSLWRSRKLFTTKIPPYAQVGADKDILQLYSTKWEVNPQEDLPIVFGEAIYHIRIQRERNSGGGGRAE